MSDDAAIIRGRVVRERRQALGLSQPGLAEAVGVSRQMVGKWERGSGIGLKNAAKLATALGIPVDALTPLQNSDKVKASAVDYPEPPSAGHQGVNVLVFETMPVGSPDDIIKTSGPTCPYAQWIIRNDRVIQIRVSGESLEPRYRDGDYVLVDMTVKTPYQRELVWCEVEGERLFLRYERRKDGSEVVTPHNRGCGPTHPVSGVRILGAIIAGVRIERRRRTQ